MDSLHVAANIVVVEALEDGIELNSEEFCLHLLNKDDFVDRILQIEFLAVFSEHARFELCKIEDIIYQEAQDF